MWWLLLIIDFVYILGGDEPSEQRSLNESHLSRSSNSLITVTEKFSFNFFLNFVSQHSGDTAQRDKSEIMEQSGKRNVNKLKSCKRIFKNL